MPIVIHDRDANHDVMQIPKRRRSLQQGEDGPVPKAESDGLPDASCSCIVIRAAGDGRTVRETGRHYFNCRTGDL